MLQKVAALAPAGYIVIRATFYGNATLGKESLKLMSALNSSDVITSGCTGAASPWNTTDCASPTAEWAGAAARVLQELLSAADAAVPGRVVGVQLGGLSTFEWMLPHHDTGRAYWPAYSATLQAEFCASQAAAHGAGRGCTVPTAEQRNSPTVGNLFLTADSPRGAAAIDYANFTARLVASTIATLCRAAKDVSGGNLFTFAFYGYTINSATDLQFTGHAALAFLLGHDDIDGVSSPTLYSAAARGPVPVSLT